MKHEHYAELFAPGVEKLVKPFALEVHGWMGEEAVRALKLCAAQASGFGPGNDPFGVYSYLISRSYQRVSVGL